MQNMYYQQPPQQPFSNLAMPQQKPVETKSKNEGKINFCPKCGPRIGEGQVFCPNCGNKIK